MKSVIDNLYRSAKNDLNEMQKSQMSLKDRIKYERALANLDAMKQIVDQFTYPTAAR